MIISPIDNLLTVARCAQDYVSNPGGIHHARLRMALANLKAIPGTGSGPQRAADALQDLATQLNRLAATIGYPGPQWDSQGFPNLASALVGYEARCKLAAGVDIDEKALFEATLKPTADDYGGYTSKFMDQLVGWNARAEIANKTIAALQRELGTYQNAIESLDDTIRGMQP